MNASVYIIFDLKPKSMLSAGLLLIKISEYFETADVDTHFELIEGWNNQVTLLMTSNQK